MAKFHIPFLSGFLVAIGNIISTDGNVCKVQVVEGFMAGQETDISNRYIVK